MAGNNIRDNANMILQYLHNSSSCSQFKFSSISNLQFNKVNKSKTTVNRN